MFRVSCEPPFRAYYNLGAEDHGTTITIDMPNDVWRQVLTLISLNQYRNHIRKWFRVGDFIFPSALPWGYAPVFMDYPSPIPDWHRIICELPCFIDANGEIMEHAWVRGREIIASLWFLITCLENIRDDTHAQIPPYQSLELVVSGGCDDHSLRYAIGAGISDACCNWITSHQNAPEIGTITTFMQNAYCRMYRLKTIDRYSANTCCAKVRSECSISFDAPGDRCGIGTYTNHRQRFGIEMYDHNVDTPVQVLTLLVGLAKFNQLASQQK